MNRPQQYAYFIYKNMCESTTKKPHPNPKDLKYAKKKKKKKKKKTGRKKGR